MILLYPSSCSSTFARGSRSASLSRAGWNPTMVFGFVSMTGTAFAASGRWAAESATAMLSCSARRFISTSTAFPMS